jgi:hypothetical protein
MRIPIIAIALCLCGSLPLLAGGTEEKTRAEKTFDVFVLAENEGEAQIFAAERMSVPASFSLFSWTRFTSSGGQVSTESSSEYALRSSRKVDSGSAGRLLVLEYRVSADPRESGEQPAKNAVDVGFTAKDCAAANGSVLFQPARMAFIRAVAASGRRTGFARIAELSYQGEGRFSARVELR